MQVIAPDLTIALPVEDLSGEDEDTRGVRVREALRAHGATDIVVSSYGDVLTPTTVVEVSR